MSQSISLLLKKEGKPLAPALRTQGERVVAAILAAGFGANDVPSKLVRMFESFADRKRNSAQHPLVLRSR